MMTLQGERGKMDDSSREEATKEEPCCHETDYDRGAYESRSVMTWEM
jgi:hypothetical protein